MNFLAAVAGLLVVVVVVVVRRGGGSGGVPVRGGRARGEGDGRAHRGVHRLQLGIVAV